MSMSQVLPLPDDAVAPVGWIAHKFGGSSLADAACIRHVATLLRATPERVRKRSSCRRCRASPMP